MLFHMKCLFCAQAKSDTRKINSSSSKVCIIVFISILILILLIRLKLFFYKILRFFSYLYIKTTFHIKQSSKSISLKYKL